MQENDAVDLASKVEGLGVLVGIDGPSGSGKSTISRQVANDLGLAFLETGAMYRALTWLCLQRGVDVADAEAVREVAEDLGFRSEGTVDEPQFFVGETNVTSALRESEVAGAVSTVSGHPLVREKMVSAQRNEMLKAKKRGEGMVAEGRDITTVVCPDADVLVLLQADPEVRLARRVLETYGEVTDEGLEEMKALVYGRDAQDALVTQFETAREGVTTIDSSQMSVEEVVGEVFRLVHDFVAGEAVSAPGVEADE